ncbi:LPS export ABC transporter permease LptF [Yoonia sp.]|uniref:LPS export ABC transporter permease LptF n=1 Tax=Yoonia sp. TaxID=2212373 RepID=UPI0025FF6F67|nr:LPS export ABC transporter permease LptF [Yoonia sp.]
MGRFDRYLLSQLMVLFGFFSLVLVLVYWINRAVVLFDQLIADGQSASVFLEFTALSLPSVIRLALPLSAFAASVYVTNRMTTESELIVVQATGYSAFRLARPVLYFGLIVALLMSILMHFLVPLSGARLAERQADIAQNVTARLLTEGKFLEPMSNVTFYIREITPAGELHDIFLSDSRNPAEQVIYTAALAFLLRDAGETQLVMIDGMAQTLRTKDQQLFTTSFDDFAYNIGSLINARSRQGRSADELSTWELLNPTPALEDETRQSAARLISRGHDRFSQALLGTVAALLGFSTLLVGGFSRFGVWRQIIAAIGLIVVVKAMETVGLNLARSNENLWFTTYLPGIVGLCIVWGLLFAATRPYLFKRRIKEALTS